MPKDPKWVMVRLKRETQKRLRSYRMTQWELAMLGTADVPESGRPGGGMPSWDWVVSRLLDLVDAHRLAAQRQRERRRVRRAEQVFKETKGEENGPEA